MGRGNQSSASAADKPRGRPRKSLGEDQSKDEVRARGRESQKLFRLRQQALVRTLEQRTTSLEDVVDAMSNEFMALGEKILQTGNIMSQPDMLVEIKERTEKFLDMARSVERMSLNDEAVVPGKAVSGGTANYRRDKQSPSTTGLPFEMDPIGLSAETSQHVLSGGHLSNFTSTMPEKLIDADIIGLDQSISHKISPVNGSFSPRLDYGFFGASPHQPHPKVSMPWSHYLIAGPNSFAMRLYIDTLDVIGKVLQGEVSMAGFLPSICRYRFRYERPDTFMMLIRRQLNLINPGNYRSDAHLNQHETENSLVLLGPADYSAMNLIPNIFKDAHRELGSLDNWLDPWGAQQYILSKWGLQLTSTTVKIQENIFDGLNTSMQWQWGDLGELDRFEVPANSVFPMTTSNAKWSDVTSFHNSYTSEIRFSDQATLKPVTSTFNGSAYPQILDVQSLVQQLIMSAICFGDGPRFLKSEVDKIIQQLPQEHCSY